MVRITSRSMAAEHNRKAARKVEASAKTLAPVKTGRLKTSIGTKHTIGDRVITSRVGSGVRYAYVNDRRASAHIIRARRARALKFFWEREGRVFVGPLVHH